MSHSLCTLLVLIVTLSACSTPKEKASVPSFCAQQTDSTDIESCHQPGVKDSTISFRQQYTNLSNTLIFELSYTHVFDNLKINKQYWRIITTSPSQKKLHEVTDTTGWFNNRFIDAKNVRSYITGVNQNKPVVDNSYGHFIVADFNFDQREDFAIMHDIGGTSGPYYSFYLQQDHQQFVKDDFLSDSVRFFPSKIDSQKKRIHTQAISGNVGVQEHIYTYNPTTTKWQNHAYTLH